MKAVIDIGNTTAELGLFEDDSDLEIHSIELNKIVSFLVSEKVTDALISNVRVLGPIENEIEQKVNNLEIFTYRTPMPISTIYETPDTLGVDRLAACIGARKHRAGNLLVIDTGTCITYDLLTNENIHTGGIISPGIHMRLKAMHTFTSNLPLVPFETTELEGRTTKGCLQSGAVNGTLNEMKGFIEEYVRKYKEITVIIGGGDAIFFDKQLELNTFVVPNLVLEGLHTIFKYNEKK